MGQIATWQRGSAWGWHGRVVLWTGGPCGGLGARACGPCGLGAGKGGEGVALLGL